jgi:hypothetical protein
MTEYRKGLPRLPARMLALPVSDKGYPVPYFVQFIDGVPDFRVIDPVKFRRCITNECCWVCGAPLGRYKVFVAGPISGVTRISGEPASHYECALFAVQACPFMLLPRAQRRDANLPQQIHMNDGHLDRNPGVAMLWITHTYGVYHGYGGDTLLKMGDPLRVEWYSQGRRATRAEVEQSIRTGLPMLGSDDKTGITQAVEALALHYPA